MDEKPQHSHCVNCVSRRCMIRPDNGVSCDLIGCPHVCGAVFHSCKADEHRILCPLERVPCLNNGFGCPFFVTRNKLAEHLQICPASVVCCTMEWNRWPVSYADRKSYETLSKDVDEVEQLDMALALQDQRMLLESLKVATTMPKTSEKLESHKPISAESLNCDKPTANGIANGLADEITNGIALKPADQISNGIAFKPADGLADEITNGVASEIANGIAHGVSDDEDSYSALYQATVETTKSLAAALDILNNATRDIAMLNGRLLEASCEMNKNFQLPEQNCIGNYNPDQEYEEEETVGAAGGIACSPVKHLYQNGSSDLYPGSNGSYDLVNEDVDLNNPPLLCNGFHTQTKNMCMDLNPGDVHIFEPRQNGDCDLEMDSEEGLLNPNKPLSVVVQAQESGMVYGIKAEDTERDQRLDGKDEQGLRNVAVFGRRPFLVDAHWFKAKMEDKAVDTADLDIKEDPMGLNGIDLITAALLFCLGDSPGGRGISDSRNVDGYHVDFGTQTFSFPSAILATNTMVGEIASASACDHANPQLSNPSPFQTLGLDLVLECVARYQTKQRSMFTFLCGQLFRRDEFSSHFKNVHGDIHAGLNGWIEQRCPLAYYGCTYSQRRFCPSTQGSKIIHDRHLRSFGVQPHLSACFENARSCSVGLSHDHFSNLPYEVLQHIAGFLDGFSLCQFSRVSKLMRDVCASLLQARGMVVLLWEKRQYPSGSSWQIKEKVWRFSTAFCTVREWKFAGSVSMADHLKKCSYNTVEKREEAVPLPCMCVTRELTKDGRSLRSVLKPVL
ncbi:F-box protein 30 S homeolog [Xenopus laevis]|uniref:F-box only protein 30 n=1 Tax=Xenopus laevis TaxID=8355 RepID=J7GX34_XENLA|nr:F-box protein 30 S homeolog [Xenopus laevis]AFP87273.1 F-box protein 30-B [Xenopus laevis]